MKGMVAVHTVHSRGKIHHYTIKMLQNGRWRPDYNAQNDTRHSSYFEDEQSAMSAINQMTDYRFVTSDVFDREVKRRAQVVKTDFFA